MKAGRGATTISENSEEAILFGTKELFREFIKKNNLENEQIVSVIFTATKDITKAFPARAIRELGYKNVALLDMEQKFVENDLKLCIRMLVFTETDEKVKPIYLHKAKKLRKDIEEEL